MPYYVVVYYNVLYTSPWRTRTGGTGKRGGARVHYLYLPRHDVIYLLYVYVKREADSLRADQKRALKGMAAALAAEWD